MPVKKNLEVGMPHLHQLARRALVFAFFSCSSWASESPLHTLSFGPFSTEEENCYFEHGISFCDTQTSSDEARCSCYERVRTYIENNRTSELSEYCATVPTRTPFACSPTPSPTVPPTTTRSNPHTMREIRNECQSLYCFTGFCSSVQHSFSRHQRDTFDSPFKARRQGI